MGWVRLDDEFYDHPKFEAAGPLGIALWTAALGYCNRKLSDGKLPRSVMRRLLDFDEVAWKVWVSDAAGGRWEYRDADPLELADHLVECGLFERGPGGSYAIHDYLDFQPSAAEVAKKREDNKIKLAEWRARNRKKGAAS